ncbi:hypothetical protein EXIGLDRAFT_759997 [Exidia glandulosa HHB12029]|uniref:Uncharacterized protein n=1 Tax=Exidia glandulosa HHB12029 TaxID=1314781 RepID=A0A165PQ44_EXIGL|nr:hypothetical protein EXIGLDRAFT_759997 [Exidia glandulosa HHB12029]
MPQAAQSMPSPSPSTSSSTARFQQFDDYHSALEPFSKLVLASTSPTRAAVRIHCTVPTWTPDCHSLSLDDVHELRTRALYFIHNLLNKLRAAGVQATYQLAPACGSSVALRALPLSARSPSPTSSACSSTTDDTLRDKALMASIDGVPTLTLS